MLLGHCFQMLHKITEDSSSVTVENEFIMQIGGKLKGNSAMKYPKQDGNYEDSLAVIISFTFPNELTFALVFLPGSSTT